MRVKWIDTAKGMAMICIIIGHIGGGNYGKVYLSFVYTFNVAVFFLLSGYTLKIEHIISEYVNKKFKRLMLPYFYTCCAVMLMDIFNSIFISKDGRILTITNILVKDIARSFFASGTFTNFADIDIGRCIGAIWFFPAMFFALLIIQVVLNMYVERWIRWAVVIIIALMGFISSKFIWMPFSVQSGMTASVFILAGYYIKKYSILEKLKWIHYIFFLIFFILGVYKGYDHFYIVVNAVPDLIISFCMAFAGSFLLIKLARYAEKISIINFIGEHSSVILCTHLVAIETMGWYFDYTINFLGIINDTMSMWVKLALNLIFAVLATFMVLVLKRLRMKIFATSINTEIPPERDCSADIMKGILIILMLVGHSVIDPDLKRIIYSCHIVAFVFLSGYFYRPGKGLRIEIIRICKSFFIPYGCFCIVHLILHLEEISTGGFLLFIKSYIFAISFSEKLFTDIPSIGPVYFICLLFLVRIIYLSIDYFTNSKYNRILIILTLSLIGVELGNLGYWLPWSLDCVLYCLIFYEIGVVCKRLNILSYVCTHFALYFILAIIWAYMIYTSSMEIAVRHYSPYGIVIFGALSGIFLLYMLSDYLSTNMMNGIRRLLKKAGENTLYIIIIHGLLGGSICSWVSKYMNGENIYHMIVSIGLQIFIGTLIGIMVNKKLYLRIFT